MTQSQFYTLEISDDDEQMSKTVINNSNDTGRTCDPRSHLIGLPGQVGVPTNGDNLDDGQPAERTTFYVNAVRECVGRST